MTTPTTVAIAPATSPIVSEVRVPYIRLVKTSWPRLSVPSQACADGGS